MKEKLTKALIFQIKNSGGSAKELAAKFGLSETTIRRARRSKRFVTV
jgi:transposase